MVHQQSTLQPIILRQKQNYFFQKEHVLNSRMNLTSFKISSESFPMNQESSKSESREEYEQITEACADQEEKGCI